MESLATQLKPLLSGAVSFDQLSEHVQNAAMIYIHFRASAIVDSGEPGKIKKEIEDMPEPVRDLVRKKCRELYRARFLDQ